MSARLLVCALALAGVAYVLAPWRAGAPPAAGREPAAPASPAGEGEGLAGAIRGAHGTPAARVAVDAPRAGAPRAAAREDAPHRAPGGGALVLAGTLLGLGGLDPSLTELRVEANGRTVGARGRADGTYALALDALEPATLDAAWLQVRADHPAGRAARAEARIDDGLRERLARERVVLTLDLDLTARTAVVGRVAKGSPEAALVRAGVLVATAERDDDHADRFALFPPEPGAFELCVHTPGHLPLRLPVEVAEGEVRDVGTLVLEDAGVAIEGRFVPGELLRPRIALTATRADLDVDEAAWCGVGVASGRVLQASAEVQPDGTFRFDGLEPGAYTLALADRLLADGAQLEFPDATVRAPARAVEFGRDVGLVRLVVRGAEGESCRLLFDDAAEPEHEGHRTRALLLPTRRPVEVLVDRRRAFSVAAAASRARAPWHPIPSGRPATLEATLELRDTPGNAPGALELAWHLPEGLQVSQAVRAHASNDSETVNWDGTARADGCRFDARRPGRYRVVVVPVTGQPGEPLPSFLATRAVDVVIEADRVTRVEVDWQLGGRARFVPVGPPRGELEGLDAEVRDAGGARCVATFVRQAEGADGARESSAQVSLLVPSEVEPTLAPGRHTLVLHEEGQVLDTVPFEVVAGTLVDVPLVLQE